MSARVIAETIHCHADPRGWVFEPLEPDLIPSQRNVHVVVTGPGGIRGNHRHQHGTETAVVIGPALVRLREDGHVRDITVSAGEALRLTIPPGIAHAFQNTGLEPMLMIAFNTVPHDPAQRDLVRDVLIPAQG